MRERPFEYSALPGRYATSVAGVVSLATLPVAAAFGARGSAGIAMLVLTLGIAVLLVFGVYMARRGVLELPLLRRASVNLEATRASADGAPPRLWLVAHLDSKSQPVPMAARVAGIASSALVWLVALALAGAGWRGWIASGAPWRWVGLAGALASIPVMLSVVGERSPGALDNASGVATVLLAALALPRDVALGLLLPSAEELGLAGTRAWVRGRAAAIALNCDGVDDAGGLTIMHTSRAGQSSLVAALERAAVAERTPIATRRLVPGILTDAVALADAGWAAVTLSRGTWRTLGRIHSRHDMRERLDGRGIEEAARVLARAARELA